MLKFIVALWFLVGAFIGGACAFVFVGSIVMAALFSTSMVLSDAVILFAPYMMPLAIFGGVLGIGAVIINVRR